MTEIAVYNAAGEPRSLDWLRAKYGPFIIYNPPPLPEGHTANAWKITTLREKCNAPAAVVVRTLGIDGAPLPGTKVAWYWPDAPADAECGPLGAPFEEVRPGRAVNGYANGEGDTGFAMGPGAYYYPDRGEKGPHATWIHGDATRSDLLLGLGMLPGTNHDHIDPEFSLVAEDGGDDDDDDDDDGNEFLFLMTEVLEQLTRIADLIEEGSLNA